MNIYWFVLDKDGKRMAGFCYGEFNGAEEAAKKKAAQLGLTISEPRCCPYVGCPGSSQARPPCALCYE